RLAPARPVTMKIDSSAVIKDLDSEAVKVGEKDATFGRVGCTARLASYADEQKQGEALPPRRDAGRADDHDVELSGDIRWHRLDVQAFAFVWRSVQNDLFAELTNFIAASHDRSEARALQHPLHGRPIVKKVMVVALAKIGVDGLAGGCGLPPLREPIRLIEVSAHDPLGIGNDGAQHAIGT